MQCCSYCGRENEEAARRCRECGTELPEPSNFPKGGESSNAQATAPPLNLPAEAFTEHDGFSRPCWPTILKTLRSYSHAEERLAAWAEVASQWMARWEAELGDEYWMTRAGSFFLVSNLDGEMAQRILERANRIAAKIRTVLGSLAWEDRPYIVIAHVPDETLAGRLYDAVSPVGGRTRAESSADDLALPWILSCEHDENMAMHSIKQDLEWNCLRHMSTPRWLRLGILPRLERAIESGHGTAVRELFDADLIPQHREFWDETTIQSFWAGTCEMEYPGRSNLCRDLSIILVQLVNEKTARLVDFLRCATPDDAGQAAARAWLKMDLGELAGTFLEPGPWAPDPVAIVECWERYWERTEGNEEGDGF